MFLYSHFKIMNAGVQMASRLLESVNPFFKEFLIGTWATWPADIAEHTSSRCTFMCGMKIPN